MLVANSQKDGAYLARLLLDKGYGGYGTYRRLSTPNFWRLQCLDIFHGVSLVPTDLNGMSSIMEAIQIASPDGMYNSGNRLAELRED